MTPPAILHRVRGQGYDTLGEFERAQTDYEQALHLARLSGDRLMEWQCLLDLGLLWTGRDYAQAGPWFRQALTLAEQLASPHAASAQSEPPGQLARQCRADRGGLTHASRGSGPL